MKVLLVSLALTFIVAIAAIPTFEEENPEQVSDIIGNLINKTINKIINNMTDPLKVKDMKLIFNNTGTLTGGVAVTNMYVAGIKSLLATAINVNVLATSIKMNLTIKDISVKFNYDLDILLLELLPLYGMGMNDIDLSGIELDISGKAVVKGSKIQLSNLTVLVSLESATFNLNGILNNPELSALISEALNDNLVPFVNENNSLLSKILGGIIEKVINGILGTNYSEDSIENDYEKLKSE